MSTRPPPPRLENRLPAEGINSSTEHPLREAAWLIGAALGLLAVVLVTVSLLARWLAPRVPFETELALMAELPDPPQPPALAARSQALQALADRVAAQMALPPGMRLQVRVLPGRVPNAYASLGGRIRVYEGLLDQLATEEALAALLAHEIAHVRERHVAANLGRGLALALVLGVVSADAGATAAQAALGQAASLGLMSYSRDQESQADAAALRAVVALYGDAGGMVALLRQLQSLQAGWPGDRRGDKPAETTKPAPTGGERASLLSTHPATAERLAAVEQQARANGWSVGTPTRPLPAGLRSARSAPQ